MGHVDPGNDVEIAANTAEIGTSMSISSVRNVNLFYLGSNELFSFPPQQVSGKADFLSLTKYKARVMNMVGMRRA